jgi:3-oxoadipate enol-lactonase
MSIHLSYLEQGHGPALLFLHGIGGNAAGWRNQLDEFSRAYRTIAWDMPGYGGSIPLSEPSFSKYAQCLHEFLAEHEIEQPILVGHSIGGMIVQEFLATYPGLTRAAVLYATSPAFGRKDGEWQQQFIRERLGPLDEGKTMAQLAPDIVKSLIGPGATAAGIALATRSMAAVPENTYRATMHCLLDFDRREALGQINIPCLLIAGEVDTNAAPAMMEKMAAKIPGAQFRCLPNLGHLAHMEDPAAFNAILSTFLDELSCTHQS